MYRVVFKASKNKKQISIVCDSYSHIGKLILLKFHAGLHSWMHHFPADEIESINKEVC